VPEQKTTKRIPLWLQERDDDRPIFSLVAVVGAAILLTVGAGVTYYGMPKEDRAVTATGVLCLVVGFILLIWFLPLLQVPSGDKLSPKERIELRDKTRATLAQILGGVALLVGVYSVAENWRMSKSSEFTDRLIRCIQLLAAENKDGKKQIDSRVGAIYSLDRISRDSGREQRVVMEIIAAYIQTNSPKGALSSPQVDADVQAALNVLIGREKRFDPPGGWLDLSYVNLKQADFTVGADVTGARLGSVSKVGRVRFVDCNLDGAFLTGVDLRDGVFTAASMKDAFLIRARLDGADLSSANLSGARLNEASLVGARMDGTRLLGADLSGAVINQEQLNSSVGNSSTLLPTNRARPTSWTGHH
jgi:uncharacterized protein YjbI with pentapeptide repeats